MRKTYKPTLELLEDRLTPSTWGVTWPDPGHLTVSFVPDGTNAAGAPSSLFQKLNAQAPTSIWKTEILRALQTWAAKTNIDLGVVPDGGQPLGTTGAVQGDARFGDIRIAAKPLQPTAVATTAGFSWTGTTWAGDMVFNSNMSIGLGGRGQYDLYTVALHEAGHIFGFGDQTTDPQSVMYTSYVGPRTGLSSQDIAGIQSLYGVRDLNTAGNNSFATATPIGNSPSQLAFRAELSSPNDADYYKVVTPFNLLPTSFNIQLKTSGISLLVPSVSIYDASYHLLTTAAASSPLNGDLNLTINNIRSNATYYFKVNGATSDVFGAGAYQVNITYQNLLSVLTGVLSSVVDYTVTNVVLPLASPLLPTEATKTDQRFDYVHEANINFVAPQHYYQIQAPSNGPALPFTMHVLAWGTDWNGLQPVIHLFDGNQNPIPVQVLANGGGLYSLQVQNVLAGAPLYVEVAALNPNGSSNTGNFFLGVKFDTNPPSVLDALGNGTLANPWSTDSATLNMAQNGVFHFLLTADNGGASSATDLTMTIYDQSGNAVLTLDATTGQPPVSAAVYLQAGNYTISYSIRSSSGDYVPVNYWLDGEVLSDPQGPYYTNGGSGSGGSGYSYGGSGGGGPPPHNY